jgi:hypothetical protein
MDAFSIGVSSILLQKRTLNDLKTQDLLKVFVTFSALTLLPF